MFTMVESLLKNWFKVLERIQFNLFVNLFIIQAEYTFQHS